MSTMLRLFFMACAFLLLTCAAPLAGAQDTSADVLESREIEAARDPAADADIAERIRGIFSEIPSLAAITVEVRQGVVTLSGEVANDAAAERAVRLASRLTGGQIFNDLETRTDQLIRGWPVYLLALGVFLFVAIGGWLLSGWAALWSRLTPNPFIAELLSQIVRVLAIFLAVIMALSILGAPALLSTFAGGAGLLGLAIGFAVRDTIENYIASIMLSLRQPFRANERVKINEHEGVVIRLTSRATVLMTLDGNHLRIPNADVFKGDEMWAGIEVEGGLTYGWDSTSTYVQNPPYFEGMSMTPDAPQDIAGARILGLFGDSITTDHISPAGAIKADSPAGSYLQNHQVPPREFNSYGSRRGNHEVMMRGTFANIRIKNQMLDGIEGGFTKKFPSGDVEPIYDASMAYQKEGAQLVVIGGKEYGTGSSRDWAAKGTRLLGVRAVIAESFERIHRSNLIGMGVLPLQFEDGVSRETLELTGDEHVSVTGVSEMTPRQMLDVTITFADGHSETVKAMARIDTENELEYFRNGGILHYVLRNLAAA